MMAAICAFLLATLVSGIICLLWRLRAMIAEHVLAPAGMVLLASSLAQARSVLSFWRGRPALRIPVGEPRFWIRCGAGAFGAYLIALALGPIHNIACAWGAAVVAWYSTMLWLAAAPSLLEDWRRWSQRRGCRRLAGIVYASILLLICAEAGLRGQKLAQHHGWLAGAEEPMPTGDRLSELTIDVRSDAVAPIVPRRLSSRFRVAVIGDVMASGPDSYWTRVEQMLAGAEIVPVGVADPWASAGQDWSARLASYQPDLAVAVVHVCEEVSREQATTTCFDWRQLELFARIGGRAAPCVTGERAASPSGGDDFEAFLGLLVPQLSACCTPIESTMRARWEQKFASLDTLIAACRDRQVPLALVLVPGAFQVNRGLCDTLARRSGFAADHLDVELPNAAGPVLPSLAICRRSICCRTCDFAGRRFMSETRRR